MSNFYEPSLLHELSRRVKHLVDGSMGGGAVVVLYISGSGVTPSRLIAKPKLPLFDIGPSQHLTMGIRMIPPPGAKGHDRIEAHDNCQCQEPCLPEYAPKGWGHGNSGEYLPSMHESWGLISTPQKLGIMVYACHPSTLETEGGLEAQDHPCARQAWATYDSVS